MSTADLRDEVSAEVEAILSQDFKIEVVQTSVVPHSSDPAITFPNLDNKTQGAKLIDTCVLYIDIRRSTELNLTHKQETVAKLYSAFVRAMTRCARHHKGHVRGIIGDRVMVIFDRENAFVNAVECAISMNATSQHVINKYFKRDDVQCGIGIDTGKMLATKTGLRRKGVEQAAYRNLVWLGRPANVASKLTDLANKPAEQYPIPMVVTGSMKTILGGFQPQDLIWKEVFPSDFVRGLSMETITSRLRHADPLFQTMYIQERTWTRTPKTKPILMTESVWLGYKAAAPNARSVVNGWFERIELQVPGYNGAVYSGDVIYGEFTTG